MTNPVSPVSAEELLPCPFCGGTKLSTSAYDIQPDNFHSAYVTCGDCEARGQDACTLEGWLSSKDEAISEAITAWNRRSPAASGAKVPEGYALVPIEPTDEMALAAIKASLMHTGVINGVPQYKAMIVAAPIPPDPNAVDDSKEK